MVRTSFSRSSGSPPSPDTQRSARAAGSTSRRRSSSATTASISSSIASPEPTCGASCAGTCPVVSDRRSQTARLCSSCATARTRRRRKSSVPMYLSSHFQSPLNTVRYFAGGILHVSFLSPMCELDVLTRSPCSMPIFIHSFIHSFRLFLVFESTTTQWRSRYYYSLDLDRCLSLLFWLRACE